MKTSSKILARVLYASLALAPVRAALADVTAPPPPAQFVPYRVPPLERGFQLRSEFGGGALNVGSSSTERETKGALALSVMMGGAIARNLLFHGNLWILVGTKTDSHPGDGLIGIGPRLSYYLMPVAVFFALTPSLTVLGRYDSQSRSQAIPGFGAVASVGKEWFPRFYGIHLGIGLSGQLIFSFNTESSEATTVGWKPHGFAIVTSLAYL